MGKKKRQMERIKKLLEKEQNSQNKKPSKKENAHSRPTQKRKPHDLQKLYEKGIIDQRQYASGERLIRDYELSFKNKSLCNLKDEVRVQKANHNNSEFFLIQNLDAWDRYNRAIMSIQNQETREIVKMFCIDGLGLTEIDKKLGKRGVAEVRLWYGLRELGRVY